MDYHPTADWFHLERRAQLLRRLRQFFEQRGFLEVETPLLSADSVVDRHLDPLSVTLFADPREPAVGRTLWLQTSPEFGMKRLMAAGARALFQVTRAFRGGERGRLHNPEFTIVEWYRRGDDYEAGMELLAELTCRMLGVADIERLSYGDAFLRYAGVDPHSADVAELAALAHRTDCDDRDELLNLILAERVEPHLGATQPTILFDYPASQAALARVRDGDPPAAERFELYVRGIELANGYHELLDPAVLRRRNAANNQARVADGKYVLPEESRLLAAMDEGLPACSGVALGFDRLVLVALGAQSIDEVIAFPIERA